MSSNPVLNADGYKLIARCLGRTLAYIMHEQGALAEPMAFRVTVDSLIREFEQDNPKFDARRFRRVLEAAMISETEEEGPYLGTERRNPRRTAEAASAAVEDQDVQGQSTAKADPQA